MVPHRRGLPCFLVLGNPSPCNSFLTPSCSLRPLFSCLSCPRAVSCAVSHQGGGVGELRPTSQLRPLWAWQLPAQPSPGRLHAPHQRGSCSTFPSCHCHWTEVYKVSSYSLPLMWGSQPRYLVNSFLLLKVRFPASCPWCHWCCDIFVSLHVIFVGGADLWWTFCEV